MNRRHLVLVALTLVVLSSVTGVGSVSSVTAERGVSVAVAEDEEAYLGIEFTETDWPNRTRTLEVTNRASTSPIEVTASGTTVTVGPGEAESLTVPCGTVDLAATGSGVSIDVTRSVDCERPDDDSGDDPRNNGQCSNSEANGKSGESGSCGGGSDGPDDGDEQDEDEDDGDEKSTDEEEEKDDDRYEDDEDEDEDDEDEGEADEDDH